VFSVYGYNAIDAFIRAAQKAGPNLTTDSFIKAMDSLVIPPDIFGSPESSSAARLGNDLRLSQIQDGRWKVVSDYVKPYPRPRQRAPRPAPGRPPALAWRRLRR
jgi:branched-chain amino acid transport system substrate-binding protein